MPNRSHRIRRLRGSMFSRDFKTHRTLFSFFRGKALLSYIGLTFSLFAFYGFLGLTCLHFATINENSSPFWPATGLAIAAVVLFGKRALLGIFLGAFGTNLTTEIPVFAVAAIALGNTFEAFLGAWLFQSVKKHMLGSQLRRPLAILTSVLISSIFGSLIGTGTLFFSGEVSQDKFLYSMLTWWGGDFTGGIIFLPLFLHCMHLRSKHFLKNWYDFPLFVFFLSAIFFVNYFVFVYRMPEGIFWANTFFIYAAIYFLGRFSGQIFLVITSVLAIYFSHLGYSLFEFGSSNLNMLYLQGVTSSLGASILFMEAIHRTHTTSAIHRVFFAGLIIIISAVSYLAFEENRLRNFELDRLIEKVQSSLEQEEKNYTSLLLGAAGMIESQDDLQRQDWQRFAKTIQLSKYFRAVNGIGFVSIIPKTEVRNFEQKMFDFGVQDFSIKVLDSSYSKQFHNHYVITFIEPYEPNIAAVGLDLGSEERRRTAAERAKNLNRAIATEPIRLIQDSKRPGFLIYYPVWKGGTQKFLGWAYAPIVAEQFFLAALSSVSDKLSLKIRRKNQLIFGIQQDFPKEIFHSKYFVQKEVNLFGLAYQVSFHPKESFFVNNAGFPLVIGVILTILLTVLIALISNIAQFNSKLVREVKRKSREVEMEKAKSLHSAKLASLGEMSAGIAHEINNPLAIITGTLAVLNRARADENKFQERVEKIARATSRIERIVLGLRKFSRTSGENEKKLEDLNTIVQESVLLTNAKAKQHFVDVQIEVKGRVVVLVDLIEIEQVLVNLISNSIDAVKHLKQKWVKVVAIEENSEIVLRVIDSGSGISKEVEEKLFLPFFTTKAVGEGTGLGLSISKGILDQHGAKFSLNRDSLNTCFEIRFPKPNLSNKAA